MVITGEEVEEILVLVEDGEVIASITDENIIEKNGYKVVCVPVDD